MKKPTVVLIKSASWDSSKHSKGHPEYEAIFSLIKKNDQKARFILVGTTEKPYSLFLLDKDLLAFDIRRVTTIDSLSYLLCIFQLHLKYRPDLTIVLGMEQLMPVGIFSLFSIKFKYVPIFIGEFGYYENKVLGKILKAISLRITSFFLKLSQRKMPKLFALSNYTRDGMIERVPSLKGRIQLVSYPISSFFSLLKAEDASKIFGGIPTILMIAGIEPRKGINTLIKAVSLLDQKPYVIIKGGVRNTVYASLLREMVKELNLSDRVIFQTDSIDYDKLINLYKSATLFVFPTLEDSLGVVILEALHSHLPVIATKVGGIPDMIEEGINGLLVKPDNPEELSQAIALLLRNNALRETFRKNAVTALKRKYYKNRITLANSLQQSVDAVFTKDSFQK